MHVLLGFVCYYGVVFAGSSLAPYAPWVPLLVAWTLWSLPFLWPMESRVWRALMSMAGIFHGIRLLELAVTARKVARRYRHRHRHRHSSSVRKKTALPSWWWPTGERRPGEEGVPSVVAAHHADDVPSDAEARFHSDAHVLGIDPPHCMRRAIHSIWFWDIRDVCFCSEVVTECRVSKKRDNMGRDDMKNGVQEQEHHFDPQRNVIHPQCERHGKTHYQLVKYELAILLPKLVRFCALVFGCLYCLDRLALYRRQGVLAPELAFTVHHFFTGVMARARHLLHSSKYPQWVLATHHLDHLDTGLHYALPGLRYALAGLRYVLAATALYSFLNVIDGAMKLLAYPLGIHVPIRLNVQRHPIRSLSLSEWWSRRWNTVIQQRILRRFLFQPALRWHSVDPRQPTREEIFYATAWTFLASGLWHAHAIWMGFRETGMGHNGSKLATATATTATTPASTSRGTIFLLGMSMLSFFLLHLAGLTLEKTWRIVQWPVWQRRLWISCVMTCTMPLLMEPILRLCEW